MYFLNRDEYEEYERKNKVSIDTHDIRRKYFKFTGNGTVLLDCSGCKLSNLDVENYTNCIRWIMLEDNETMALLKLPFGDIYRNLNKEQYYMSVYNNILLPQIAKQMQNETAKYFLVEENKFTNNRKGILTLDFKDKDEKIIHGEEILSKCGNDVNELKLQNLLFAIEDYLIEVGGKHQDIKIAQWEFIKQSFFNRFVKQSDENNHNWAMLYNTNSKRWRMAPIYDLDCCCDVSTRRKHVRETKDANKFGLESFIKEFEDNEWFIIYLKEVLEDFDLEKAFKDAYYTTNIDIPEEYKERYRRFFGERFYELKSVYNKCILKNVKEGDLKEVHEK